MKFYSNFFQHFQKYSAFQETLILAIGDDGRLYHLKSNLTQIKISGTFFCACQPVSSIFGSKIYFIDRS